MMTEAQIQNQIIRYLENEMDWYVVKVGMANKSGVPDLLACDTEGGFWGFEVKKPDKKHNLTKLQRYNISEIDRHYGRAFVVTSVDEVKEYIDGSFYPLT